MPDNSFGTDGVLTTDFGHTAYARDLLVQADGKIVVVGGGFGFTAARYHSNGTPDNSFSGDGKFSLNIGSEAAHVALSPDGKIVMAGTGGINQSSGSFFARLTTTGELDPYFTRGWKFFEGFFVSDFGVLPDRKIVAISQNF